MQHARLPRTLFAAELQLAAHSPGTERIEADDDDVPTSDEHASDLAQQLMLICRVIEGVMQQYAVHRSRCQRDSIGIGHCLKAVSGLYERSKRELVAHRALMMQLHIGAAQLQQVVAEAAPQYFVHQCLFPAQQVLAERTAIPGGQRLVSSKIMGWQLGTQGMVTAFNDELNGTSLRHGLTLGRLGKTVIPQEKIMLHIEPVKAFKDNYLWVFHQQGSTQAVVVDPGDAMPVQHYMQQQGLQLAAILITHHHNDHIGGVSELQKAWQVPVYGPASEKIPQVTRPLQEGDVIDVIGLQFRVLAVPGHTLEHIAYFAADADGSPLVFCGDTLFAAGCGRMFEGTPPMMYASLQKLATLPPTTRVYCTHEYTLSNLNFAKAALHDATAVTNRIISEQRKREQDQPTVPSTIALELATNPFLRCDDPVVLASLASQQNFMQRDPAQVFGALRKWKDNF